MKNFVYQTFVLLPLTAAATFGLVMFIGPLAHVGNFGENWQADGAMIFFLICFFALFIGTSCIYLRVRGFKAGSRWWWYGLALSPVRILLQLIACIIAVIFVNSKKVISDYYFSADDDKRNNVTSLFFNFKVPRPYVVKSEESEKITEKKPRKKKKEVKAKVDKSDVKYTERKTSNQVAQSQEKKKSRFGEQNIKSRNLIFQICVLLPITAAQCGLTVFLSICIFDKSVALNDWKIVLPIILALIALPILAGFFTKIRGHGQCTSILIDA